ncbi:MAG: helix-turn-helix domain-containing protein [Ktedonobacterales bacterium]
MAADGTPEPAAKRCGEAIARIRTQRRWSRAQLVVRLYNEITSEDPSYESISETWLARLENGRMVKVPRQTIEALCRALRCTAQERSWVLLCADRSVLAGSDAEPNPVAELLTYTMERIYSEAHEALVAMMAQRAAVALDEQEMLEVTAAALETLLARRHARQAVSSARTATTSRAGRMELVPQRAATSYAGSR